jgi:hypothetical protein
MRVVKMPEAEVECVGEAFRRGCGSILAVTVEDVKRGKRREIDCFGGVFDVSWTFVECPVCGAKTAVNPDLKP